MTPRRGPSLHFKLTLGMLFMLAFVFAAGLLGVVAITDLASHGDRGASVEAIERRATLQILGVLGVGVLTVLGGSVMIARSFKRPLRALKEGAVRFAAGDLTYRVPVDRGDELGDVLELFNSMAGALERNQQELSHQAFHDTLTGLANRSLFMDRVVHALARQERDHRPVAVLLIDLDDFKVVNDTLGHAAGDELLKMVAEVLRITVRPGDTAARLGGDEFAVLIEDMRGRKDVLNIAGRILEAFTGRVVLEGKEMFVQGSIGIAITYGGEQAADLLRNADMAMYSAKAKGKNRFETFDGAMHRDAMERLDLKTELQRAVEADAFVVHYQPIVDLASDRIIGAEALLRWEHPTRGSILPPEFLPLAEETGLMIALGQRVLDEAFRQANTWQMAYDPQFRIHVNMSAREMQEDNVVETIRRAIASAPIAPGSVVIEMNEGVLAKDPEALEAKLGRLHEAGVNLALDDFGRGHSSLGYLRRLPIQTIKIDKAFTDGVAQGPEDSALARALLKLADTWGLEAIAEGIEGADQVVQLTALGCSVGQGALFGHAQPADAFDDLLREQMTATWDEALLPEVPSPTESSRPLP